MKLSFCLLLAACSTEQNVGDTAVPTTARWSESLGQRGYESATAVAIDSHGDVIVSGSGYKAPADLGTGLLGDASDNPWHFLTKRAGSNGAPIWAVEVADEPFDVAIGADDSIYTAGGGVTKYTSDGVLVWRQALGPDSNSSEVSIGLDASGNVYVVGNFYGGSFDFLGTHHADPDDKGAGFLISYTADGEPRWARVFDPPAETILSGIAMSPTGDVVIAGQLSTTMYLDAQAIDPRSSQSGFVARFHGDGSFVQFAFVGDASGRTEVGPVAFDTRDRIVVETQQEPTTPLRGGTTTPYVSVVDSAGLLWSKESALTRLPPLVTRLDDSTVTAFWNDSPYNADHPDQVRGHLELDVFDLAGNTVTAHLGQRLVAGLRDTIIHDAARGPRGEMAFVGELGGEVIIDQPIEAHGTDDTDALIILVEP